MQVVIDNTLITYTDEGNGEILLCVHGWMDDHTSYKQLAAELKDRFRIISLDLPNFGNSQLTEKIITIDDYAHFISLFIKKLQLKSYKLVGHSMGCQIAIYAIGNGYINPDKVVLLAPAGVRNNLKIKKIVLKRASKMLRNFVPNKYKKKFYLAIGSDYNPNLSVIHKKIISETLSTDIQNQAKKIYIPTLIINGSSDADTPVWMANTLHTKIRNSEIRIVANVGHRVHEDAAKLVASYIKKFV